jgi:hypothetical protein
MQILNCDNASLGITGGGGKRRDQHDTGENAAHIAFRYEILLKKN